MDMTALGARIAQLRESHGFSAAEVAAAAGISRGYLSRLENGHQLPSLVILDAIAQQFGVAMGYFFETNSDGQVAVQTGIDAIGGELLAGSSFAYEALCVQRGHKLADPFLATFRPGTLTEISAHDAEYFRYVIAGCLILHYGDDRYELRQGDAIYYDATRPHEIECLGDVPTKAVTLYVKAPPSSRLPGQAATLEGHGR